MEDGSSLPVLGIIILFLLLWLNGILYGFSAAIRNLSENEIVKQALDGNKKAVLLKKMMDYPARYVNAIPLVVTASGISIGAFLVPWFIRVSRHYIKHLPAVIIILFLCIFLLASFGILTFRRIGTYQPEKYAFRYVKTVYAIVSFLYPLTFLSTWAAKITALPFGVELNQKEDAVTEESIISIVDEAHEQGVIEESEAEMIQNIISFNETDAHEIMTHRKNVVAFNEDVLLKEMVEEMLEEGKSRYPVYRDDLNDIVGIIHYKDATKFMTVNPWAKFKPLKEIPGLIRTASFIPETRGIGDLFRFMQSKKLHMAIVVDEYGQTAGIVSMEDILEEIVGDIMDEYDDEEVSIRTQVDNSVIIDGLAYLEDVEEKLDTSFGETEFETLNGFLTSILGHIPTEADLDKEIVANGYRFKILSLGNKTLGKVRAEKINEKEQKGEERCQDIQNSQT